MPQKSEMPAVMPMFSAVDVDAVIKYYTGLGYTEKMTMNGPDGKAMHTMLVTPCGRISVMFGQCDDAKAIQNTNLYCSVPEGLTVDQAFEKIKAAGAHIESEPTTQFWGDRNFTFIDPWGLHWSLYQTVAEMKAPEGFSMRQLAHA